MTDSPSVTCPSPARTTLPLRRMDRTVVERISRFVDMKAILDYSSRGSPLMRKQESTTGHGETKGKSKGRQARGSGTARVKVPAPSASSSGQDLSLQRTQGQGTSNRWAGPSHTVRPLQCTAVCRKLFPEGERTCLQRHMRQNATHSSTPESVRKRKTLLRRRQVFVGSRLRTF